MVLATGSLLQAKLDVFSDIYLSILCLLVVVEVPGKVRVWLVEPVVVPPVDVVQEDLGLELLGCCPFRCTGRFLENALKKHCVGLSGA